MANDVERVLADIDADDGDGSLGGLGHGVLLVVGAPDHFNSLAGQEHGRTIPLADISQLNVNRMLFKLTYANFGPASRRPADFTRHSHADSISGRRPR